MTEIDTSAAAVERRIRELQEAGFDNGAATLRALRHERDAARAEVARLLADAARLACVVTGTLPDKNTMTAEECEQVENEAHDCAHRIMREYEQHMRHARGAAHPQGGTASMTARRTTLLALADRCEAASGPDRQLDAEMAFATGWRLRDAVWRPPGGEWGAELPPFTDSRDAARTLLPQEWHLEVGDRPDWPWAHAHEFPLPCRKVLNVHAATVPLTMCAAALRAQATVAATAEAAKGS